MINVGIVGGSGYTGAELIKWLLAHPHVNIVTATSRSYVDVRIDKVYPNLSGTKAVYKRQQEIFVTRLLI